MCSKIQPPNLYLSVVCRKPGTQNSNTDYLSKKKLLIFRYLTPGAKLLLHFTISTYMENILSKYFHKRRIPLAIYKGKHIKLQNLCLGRDCCFLYLLPLFACIFYLFFIFLFYFQTFHSPLS